MSLLFNMLSRLVIAFLPRSKRLLISWLQSPSAVILEPQKIKSDTVSTLPQSWESYCSTILQEWSIWKGLTNIWKDPPSEKQDTQKAQGGGGRKQRRPKRLQGSVETEHQACIQWAPTRNGGDFMRQQTRAGVTHHSCHPNKRQCAHTQPLGGSGCWFHIRINFPLDSMGIDWVVMVMV